MSVSADLATTGIAVVDGFLPPARVRSLADCLAKRRARGEFQAARIGAPTRPTVNTAIRGDATCWLEDPLSAPESLLLAELEQLRLELNRDLQLGLFELEAHYACYAPGAGYQRHVDQPQGRGRRCLSLVIYLNENWQAASGGRLRLYGQGSEQDAFDVLPLAGRLACFLSRGRAHEVLPATRERLSVTGWFLTR